MFFSSKPFATCRMKIIIGKLIAKLPDIPGSSVVLVDTESCEPDIPKRSVIKKNELYFTYLYICSNNFR